MLVPSMVPARSSQVPEIGKATPGAGESGAVEGAATGGELGVLEPLDDGETPDTGPCAKLGGRPATTATRTTSAATDASPPTIAVAPLRSDAGSAYTIDPWPTKGS